jgi:hypothetical protein
MIKLIPETPPVHYILISQSKMDNPEKLAILATQDQDKQNHISIINIIDKPGQCRNTDY